jgi:hypothetical protein
MSAAEGISLNLLNQSQLRLQSPADPVPYQREIVLFQINAAAVRKDCTTSGC